MSRARDLADSADKDIAGTLTLDGLTVDGTATVGTDTAGILNVKGGSSTSSQVRFFDGGTGRARIGVPTGQTYLSLSGSDTLTADVVINSSGNVGIGTSSAANGKLVVENNGSNLYLKQTTGDYGHIIGQNDSDGALTFSRRDSGNTERIRIDASGDIQIGKTDGTQNTQGIILNNYGTIRANSQTNEALHLIRSTAGNIARFYHNNTTLVGNINVTSSSTAYNTSSDYRLKENVVDLTDATTRLKQLAPKRFNFIVDADTTVDGFLAHEVQSVVPEAITGTHNEVDADGNPVYQGIDQSKLVPLLVATIKELEARITALEAN